MTSKWAWRVSVAASVLLLAGVLATLFGAGFHFYIVSSPSMGTTAPVGTLVVVHAADSYRVGDVVSYALKGRVYTHRIVDITDQGFITRGDMNTASDALPVAPSQIVGTVDFYGKNLGFLVEALPWLILSWAIVYGLSLLTRLKRGWRWHFRLVGWSLVTSLVGLWFRPWVNMEMIDSVSQVDSVDMHLVNTGIFPVRVLGKVLTSGQDAVVTQTVADATGRYSVTPQLALNTWYFVVLLAICLTPLLVSLLIPVEDAEAVDDVEAPAKATRRPAWVTPRHLQWGSLALTATASVVVVAMVLQMSTHAAFVATIKNSSNTAGAATFFNCKSAEISTVMATPYLAWAMDTARTTSSSEPDLVTSTPILGRYLVTSVLDTSGTVGCNQDAPKKAVVFNGSTQCLYENSGYATSGYMPNVFSIEAWFKAGTANKNGKIIGFGNSRTTAADTDYDRHIYIDANGKVVFGVYPGAIRTVSSPLSYTDNKWHHVVATLSTAGMVLYVDGAQVDNDPSVTTAQQYQAQGYWKVGCGNLANWQNGGSASGAINYSGLSYFQGSIQYAAVYSTALTKDQVHDHYVAGLA